MGGKHSEEFQEAIFAVSRIAILSAKGEIIEEKNLQDFEIAFLQDLVDFIKSKEWRHILDCGGDFLYKLGNRQQTLSNDL